MFVFSFTEFFKDFVDKSRPALFKGLAKQSPAFELWDNDYLENHPGSDEIVYVEPEKKENRTKAGEEIPFKKFIQTYQNKSIYMVNGVPKALQYVFLFLIFVGFLIFQFFVIHLF